MFVAVHQVISRCIDHHGNGRYAPKDFSSGVPPVHREFSPLKSEIYIKKNQGGNHSLKSPRTSQITYEDSSGKNFPSVAMADFCPFIVSTLTT